MSAAAKTEVHLLKTRGGMMCCRVCGCTQLDACPVGCGWAATSLCTVCYAAIEAIREWQDNARRANLRALLREVQGSMAVPASRRGAGPR